MNFSHINHFRENRTSCPCFRTAPMTAPGSARAHIALLPSSRAVRKCDRRARALRPGEGEPTGAHWAGTPSHCSGAVRSFRSQWRTRALGWRCAGVGLWCRACVLVCSMDYALSVHRYRSRARGRPCGRRTRWGDPFPEQCDCSVGFQWTVPRFLRVLVSCGGFEFGGRAVMITSPQSTLSL